MYRKTILLQGTRRLTRESKPVNPPPPLVGQVPTDVEPDRIDHLQFAPVLTELLHPYRIGIRFQYREEGFDISYQSPERVKRWQTMLPVLDCVHQKPDVPSNACDLS